jgi:hypothetical protein
MWKKSHSYDYCDWRLDSTGFLEHTAEEIVRDVEGKVSEPQGNSNSGEEEEAFEWNALIEKRIDWVP